MESLGPAHQGLAERAVIFLDHINAEAAAVLLFLLYWIWNSTSLLMIMGNPVITDFAECKLQGWIQFKMQSAQGTKKKSFEKWKSTTSGHDIIDILDSRAFVLCFLVNIQ